SLEAPSDTATGKQTDLEQPIVEVRPKQAEKPKRPAAAEANAPTPDPWADVVTPSSRSRKSGPTRNRISPVAKLAAKNRWPIVAAVVAGVLLIGLVGLWAGGVFKVKTPHGTIVLENLPVDAEVV